MFGTDKYIKRGYKRKSKKLIYYHRNSYGLVSSKSRA